MAAETDLPDVPIRARDFSRVVFFTGAGLSAESGVPTYRGAGGIWHEYDPERYASSTAFATDPARVLDFHDLRRATVGAARPHAGHRAIAALQRIMPNTVVITQNIDGLLDEAGCKDVIELHGSLWRVRHPVTGQCVVDRSSPLSERRFPDGTFKRPDIVWFGDAMPALPIEQALRALSSCDLLVSVGTSGAVYPAAELPMHAKAKGATLVEVNPEETPLSPVYDLHLRGAASIILPRLCGLDDV